MLHYLLKASTPSAIWKVADLFQCSRGFLQAVVNSTTAFASCLTYFTQVGSHECTCVVDTTVILNSVGATRIMGIKPSSSSGEQEVGLHFQS